MTILSAELAPEPKRLPRAASAEAVKTGRERWLEAAGRLDDEALAAFACEALEDADARRLLDAVFGNSPFLTGSLVADIGFARRLMTEGAEAALEEVYRDLSADGPPDAATEAVMKALRVARRRASLAIALAGLAGRWTGDQVTEALSRFADAALGAAVAHLLRQAHEAGDLALPYPDRPEHDSGFIVLGMGKLGARELNYSSDIDLILLFDGDVVDYRGRESAQQCFIRLARRLVSVVEELTRDGYVFRIDLRLRPDPGSTPLALSVLAAETYYESMGQNWERAAMIKARPVAGDRAAGERFLQALRPFVWRRSLDFDTIRDIHSIKRQINARRGGPDIAVAGHNVKLGRGGIREIEFFAQTQQLIWGGRQPAVRTPRTCEALAALAEEGNADAGTVDTLCEAYRFLRKVEHRLQMVADQQTHTVPDDSERLEALAVFLGFDNKEAFGEALLARLRAVNEYYADLFEEAAPSLSEPGTLSFTGGEDHPDTLATLERMGFKDAPTISGIVRTWHHGRYHAMRSTRARELLTELTPALLEAFSRTVNPDGALLRFDKFLAGLPAGVQLFSLFHSNPGLLTLLAEIMGSAPWLADTLRTHPILLDAVLASDFFESLPGPADLDAELAEALAQARDFQDVLDIMCRRVNDRLFQVGVHILRGHLHPEEAGRPLSDIADATLRHLYPHVEAEFAGRHGRFPGGGMAVVALGKLGGGELTIGSDLDLLFVYDAAGRDESDGAKPLVPIQYFSRLSQRYIGALSAPTGEGSLYQLDMRLRPSGHSGPIASSVAAFEHYHRDSAWTWEHMALTRARVVIAPDDLRTPLEALIREILTLPRDGDALVCAVADMRARMARERGDSDLWDVKNLRGGMVDIDFIAQYLQLRFAAETPEVLAANTTDALARLRDAGYLEPETARTLLEAMRLWRNLQGVIRLSFGERFAEDKLTEGSRILLAEACNASDFDALRETIARTAEQCHAIFRELIEVPAAAVAAAEREGAG